MQTVFGMFVRDASSVVTQRQLQRLPDQPRMEETHQGHSGQHRRARKTSQR